MDVFEPRVSVHVIVLFMNFRLMATIFDLPVTPTSERIQTSYIVLLDPENVGVAFGILLLSCLKAVIYVTVHVFPVMAAIFDSPFIPTSESTHTNPTV